MTVGVILGSSFVEPRLAGHELLPRKVRTTRGEVTLYRHPERDAWALFRHGLPHTRLPNQIDYRAHAAALFEVGCESVLVTSSVGVIDKDVPLFAPLVVDDLVMVDNRLPDGTACTMFETPSENHGHLIVDAGLFDAELSHQVRLHARDAGAPVAARVVFTYVQGPRTKTAAENQLLAERGAQVNSMSLAPEVVLLNELGIATAGLVMGHKKSRADAEDPLDEDTIAGSLERARDGLERIIDRFLRFGEPVGFKNRLHRFARTTS